MHLKEKNICRICLLNEQELNDIFHDEIWKLIVSIANVKINIDDGLPQFICNDCEAELKSAIKFKDKCEESYMKLCNYIQILTDTDQIDTNNAVHLKIEPDIETYSAIFSVNDVSHKTNDSSDSDTCTDNVDGINYEISNGTPNEKKFKPYEVITHEYINNDKSEKLIIYKCVSCGRPELNSCRIQQHKCDVKVQYDMGVLKCDICSQLVVSKINLENHMIAHEKNTNKTNKFNSDYNLRNKLDYQCNICKEKYKTEGELKRHIESHSGDVKCDKSNEACEIKTENGTDKHFEETHQCDSCGKFFADRANLRIHKRRHINDKPFKCKECDKSFIKKNLLTMHMRVHSGEKPYVCKVCSSSFTCLGNLKAHEKTHSETKSNLHMCHICNKKFSKMGGLRNHYLSHSGERSFVCTLCGKSFITKFNLTNHTKVHEKQKAIEAGTYVEPEKHQCETCGKFLSLKNLKIHMRTHTGEKPHKCAICNKDFVSKSHLISHVRVHTGERPYTCDMCGVSFSHISNLKKHIKTHLEDARTRNVERKFECHICNKMYKSNKNLKEHIQRHSHERNYPCTQCDKTFKNKPDLNQHLKKHEKQKAIAAGTYVEIKKHQCENCGKFFSERSDLTIHMRTHTGEKPYRCEVCQKGFVKSSQLTLHMRVHTGEKPYNCNFCNISFAQSGNLKSHVKICAGNPKSASNHEEKPFPCHICKKRYKSYKILKQHLISHTGERNYSCVECGKSFISKNNLNKHLKIHEKQRTFDLNASANVQHNHDEKDEPFCTICDKKFTSKHAAINHMNKHVMTF